MLNINKHYASTQAQTRTTKPLNFLNLAVSILIFGTLGFNLKAIAQPKNITSKEINNYAQAVLGMESPRQRAFEEIKKIVGNKDVPRIMCTDSKSFNPLPKKAQDIAVNYCKTSKKIVEDAGLTVEKFNSITLDLQNNNDLKAQVYKELLRLQKIPK